MIFLAPLGLVVAPIALLFRYQKPKSDTKFRSGNPRHKYIRLPKWAYIWDNSEWGAMGDDTWPDNTDDITTFWSMYKWLAIQNPLNNLQNIIGQDVSEGVELNWWGSKLVSGTSGDEGWHFVECKAGGKTTYSFYFIKGYGDKCLRIRMGYKVKPTIDVEKHKRRGDLVGTAFVINPFKSFHPKNEEINL